MGSNSEQLTPLEVFLGADWVVQSVMSLLLVASIFSWGVIISRTIAIVIERQKILKVKKALDEVKKFDELRELANNGNGKVHTILHALAREWKWSNENTSRSYTEMRQRLVTVSELALERQYVRLSNNSGWLATIGNSAPFVGLFGTVWGIMNSFIAIGQTQDTSLTTVAPGMAEALFATAIGLFCAIPASMGYNRILQALARTEHEWRAIVARVDVAISRHYAIIRRPDQKERIA
ncbi:MotA/TolQ/ExbB proton channel family protein [Erythrobacter aurantius]|uniref:MotA/TolQ/ExbB proton channel family protein n=1 Tax=Erythrobacter aurantius TaxID=2909249 RepID=UPI002E808BA9|nr:MotA/TolQ/ExbB proton channel family protein [Erythrobacter aurantius]